MFVAYLGKTGSWETQYNQDGNPANQITIKEEITISHYNQFLHCLNLIVFVKLRQGSGKDRQGMAVKVKGLKA